MKTTEHKGINWLMFFLSIGFVFFSVSSGAAQSKTLTNSIGMEFVLIPAGSFMMGADKNFEKAFDWETPKHKVGISKPFYLGKYEVTQEQWMKVMGTNSSSLQARNRPVENVSWEDVQVFINKLNQMEGGTKYRLPSEAEWEYAARAGSDTAYCYGDDPDAEELSQYACYDKNSDSMTKPVGKFKPNAWGLYDMHGNVREWVQDWHAFDYYSKSPSTDPTGPSSGWSRVIRGGGWSTSAGICRSANRSFSPPAPGTITPAFGLPSPQVSR